MRMLLLFLLLYWSISRTSTLVGHSGGETIEKVCLLQFGQTN